MGWYYVLLKAVIKTSSLSGASNTMLDEPTTKRSHQRGSLSVSSVIKRFSLELLYVNTEHWIIQRVRVEVH